MKCVRIFHNEHSFGHEVNILFFIESSFFIVYFDRFNLYFFFYFEFQIVQAKKNSFFKLLHRSRFDREQLLYIYYQNAYLTLS